MTTLLLDTHVFLWWLMDDKRLGKAATSAISDPANQVLVSAASIWEIEIKRSLGKIKAPHSLSEHFEAAGIEELPVLSAHAEEVGRLARLHRDPFDRMLIAQARTSGAVLVTSDRMIQEYDVTLMDSSK